MEKELHIHTYKYKLNLTITIDHVARASNIAEVHP
jgi:hypothetical protein